MAVNRMSKRQALRQDSFVSSTARATAFLQQNFMSVLVGLVAVGVVVVGTIWWSQTQERNSLQASQLMFQATSQYSNAAYSEALLTLDDLKSRFGGTREGRDAYYLSGAAHLALGESEQALQNFREYLDLTSQGMYTRAAQLGVALALESRGDLQEAADRLGELRAELDPESALFAQVCLAEARVQEARGLYDQAIEALRPLASTDQMAQRDEAQKRIAVLEALR